MNISEIPKFIKNTNKRYSISSQGIVYSHYRMTRSGRLYRDSIVAKNTDSPFRLFAKVVLFTSKGRQAFLVNSLMITYFKLKPPDKYNLYDLKPLDGNPFNHAITNLEFKIRHSGNIYPQPSYLDSKIVAKICQTCGEKKDITAFNLWHGKYRNDCNQCRAEENWQRIVNSPAKLRRHCLETKAWAKSVPGRRYLKRYWKDSAAHHKEVLSVHYIAAAQKIHQLGLKEKDLPADFTELCRSYILLKRTINEKYL